MIAIIDYFLIIPSILGCIGLGRIVTKSNYYSSFVFGLLTLGAIVSPLVYYKASAIYPFLKTSLIFGIFLLLIHFVLSLNKMWINKINISNILFKARCTYCSLDNGSNIFCRNNIISRISEV